MVRFTRWDEGGFLGVLVFGTVRMVFPPSCSCCLSVASPSFFTAHAFLSPLASCPAQMNSPILKSDDVAFRA